MARTIEGFEHQQIIWMSNRIHTPQLLVIMYLIKQLNYKYDLLTGFHKIMKKMQHLPENAAKQKMGIVFNSPMRDKKMK